MQLVREYRELHEHKLADAGIIEDAHEDEDGTRRREAREGDAPSAHRTVSVPWPFLTWALPAGVGLRRNRTEPAPHRIKRRPD